MRIFKKTIINEKVNESKEKVYSIIYWMLFMSKPDIFFFKYYIQVDEMKTSINSNFCDNTTNE